LFSHASLIIRAPHIVKVDLVNHHLLGALGLFEDNPPWLDKPYSTETLICLGLISSRFGITIFKTPSL
jgi:hypothetical protein